MSVDLVAAAEERLREVDMGVAAVERIGPCTFDDRRFASYRRDHTAVRQVTVAWLG
jgi:copper oxidase (laccase) domain-containing protein